MRLVRETMVPEADDGHLAEVLLGALFYEQDEDEPRDSAAVRYEFHDGVSELLIEGSPVPDTVRVVDEVSKHLARHHGSTLDFRVALLDHDLGTDQFTHLRRCDFSPSPGNKFIEKYGGFAILLKRLADQNAFGQHFIVGCNCYPAP